MCPAGIQRSLSAGSHCSCGLTRVILAPAKPSSGPWGFTPSERSRAPWESPEIDVPALLSFPVLLWGLGAGQTDSSLALLLRNYENSSQSTQTVSSFNCRQNSRLDLLVPGHMWFDLKRLKGECRTKLKASSQWTFFALVLICRLFLLPFFRKATKDWCSKAKSLSSVWLPDLSHPPHPWLEVFVPRKTPGCLPCAFSPFWNLSSKLQGSYMVC